MEKNNSKAKTVGILFKTLMAVGTFLLLGAFIFYGIHQMWCHAHPKPDSTTVEDIYQHLAVAVIITWILFLIGYYIWAIHFYNVNHGWTDTDWEKHENNQAEMPGLGTDEAPEENPNRAESLGLPPGTVRATLALSMLVTAMAMLIASFSMNNTYPPNQIFVDNFEFVKTGFLMMLAFYFGAKSLDILRKTNISNSTSAAQNNNNTTEKTGTEDTMSTKESVG